MYKVIALISIHPGSKGKIEKILKDTEHVKRVEAVTGSFNYMAELFGEDADELVSTALDHIATLDGVDNINILIIRKE